MKKFIPLYLISFLLMSFSVKAQQSFADLTEKTINSVVNISTTLENEDSSALGSGFIIDKEGYIVTNNHVINDADVINVILNNNKVYQADLIGKDEKTDIALIKINTDEELIPVTFGDSDEIRVGDWILAIGNPFGLGASVTAGIISAKSRDIDSGSYNDFIQTDASINQGNSGGPMFDMNANLIGMNTSIFSTTGNSMGIGFATPSNIISWVVEQLKNKGTVIRGWIGIKMQPNQLEVINDENSPVKEGILVLGITENSPAQKAGVTAGDIIIKINDEIIESPKNFSKIIYTTKPGEKIKLLVWNNKNISEKSINVEIFDNNQLNEQKEDLYDNKKQNYIPEIGYLYDNYDGGVIVLKVEKNSKAEALNIKKGDVIVKADNYNIDTFDDLQKYINELRFSHKENILISLLRDNEIKNIIISFNEENND